MSKTITIKRHNSICVDILEDYNKQLIELMQGYIDASKDLHSVFADGHVWGLEIMIEKLKAPDHFSLTTYKTSDNPFEATKEELIQAEKEMEVYGHVDYESEEETYKRNKK